MNANFSSISSLRQSVFSCRMKMKNEAVLTILLTFVERWLKNLPGSLVLAIVASNILTGGLPEIVATIVVVLVMIGTKNPLLAIGASEIFLARNFFI